MNIKANFNRNDEEINVAEVKIKAIEIIDFLEFNEFKENLIYDYDFIKNNRSNMSFMNNEWNVLLVLCEHSDDGILVESGGRNYARYSSYVPNIKPAIEKKMEQVAEKILKKLIDFARTEKYSVDINDLKNTSNSNFIEQKGFSEFLFNQLYNRKEIDNIVPTGNSYCINLNENYVKDFINKQEKIIQACSSNVWIMDTDYDNEDYDFYFQKFDGKVDLKNYFEEGNCALREVVIYEDLAFVQQVNGGDEWLALRDKGDHYEDFESISFKAIIQNHGETEFYNYLKSLVDDTDYSFVREMNEPQM